MIKVLFVCHGRSCGRIVGTFGLLGIMGKLGKGNSNKLA
mgnify:CR=1 FL=1